MIYKRKKSPPSRYIDFTLNNSGISFLLTVNVFHNHNILMTTLNSVSNFIRLDLSVMLISEPSHLQDYSV